MNKRTLMLANRRTADLLLAFFVVKRKTAYTQKGFSFGSFKKNDKIV